MRARLILGTPVIAGLIGAVLTVAGVRSPATAPLTLLFLLFIPAFCIAPLLTALDPLARTIVAGAGALVLLCAVAEVMLAASAWSPRGGVVTVGALSALLTAAVGIRRQRRTDSVSEYMPGSTSPDGDDEG